MLPLLNGIEHMQTLRERLARRTVVGASIGRIEALPRATGRRSSSPRRAVVMTVASDVPAEALEIVRRSGTEVRIDGSETEVLWEKLARQAPVAAATAIAQRPIGELRSDPEWRPRLQQAIAETCTRRRGATA